MMKLIYILSFIILLSAGSCQKDIHVVQSESTDKVTENKEDINFFENFSPITIIDGQVVDDSNFEKVKLEEIKYVEMIYDPAVVWAEYGIAAKDGAFAIITHDYYAKRKEFFGGTQ